MHEKFYAYIGCEKIKNPSLITDIQKHNYRLYNVLNADSNKLNYEFISRTQESFIEECNRVISEKNIVPRSNAIRAVQINTTFSHNSPLANNLENILRWAQDTLEWILEWFKGCYIISHVLHLSESTPHLHSVIIPFTEDGRLSAKEVVGGRSRLRKMQTDYANRVGIKYGLSRGERYSGSITEHTKIQQFYKAINDQYQQQLPYRTKREKDNDYYKRCNEYLINACLNAYGQGLRAKRAREFKGAKTIDDIVNYNQQMSALNKRENLLNNKDQDLLVRELTLNYLENKANILDTTNKALELLRMENPMAAGVFDDHLHELLRIDTQSNRKKKLLTKDNNYDWEDKEGEYSL